MSTYYKFSFCSEIIFFICFIRMLSCLFASDNRGIFPSHRETDARTQTSRPSPHLSGQRNAVNVMEGKREKERASCLCRSELYRLVFLLSFHRHCEKDIRERDSLTVEQKEGVRTRVHTYIYHVCSYIYVYSIDSLLRRAGEKRRRLRWTPKRAKLLPVLLAESRRYERRWTRDRKSERFERGSQGMEARRRGGRVREFTTRERESGKEWMRERRGGRALATRTKGD